MNKCALASANITFGDDQLTLFEVRPCTLRWYVSGFLFSDFMIILGFWRIPTKCMTMGVIFVKKERMKTVTKCEDNCDM